MKRFAVLSFAMALAATSLGLVACGGGNDAQRFAGTGSIGEPATPGEVTQSHASLFVGDGLSILPSDNFDDISTRFALSHLGNPSIDRVVRVSTLAGAEFGLNFMATRQYNAGRVTLRIGHIANNATQPTGGFEEAIELGLRIDHSEMVRDGNWVSISGDGLIHATMRGRFTTTQVLAAQIFYDGMLAETTAIEIAIGAGGTGVNLDTTVSQVPLAPTLSDDVVYSSESEVLEGPAVAATTDRANVSFFEKNVNTSVAQGFEIRRSLAVFNRNTGGTLGSFVAVPRPGIGDWYDQDTATLGSVVVNANVGSAGIRVDISLDGGVTFPISRVMDDGIGSPFGQRQVSVAIGAGFNIAVAYWDSVADAQTNSPRSNLKNVLANPTINTSTQAVIGYTIRDPELVRTVSNQAANPAPGVVNTNIVPGSTGVVINDQTGQIQFTSMNSNGFQQTVTIGNQNNLSTTLSTSLEYDQLGMLANLSGINSASLACMEVQQFVGMMPRDPHMALVNDTVFVASDTPNGVAIAAGSASTAVAPPILASFGSKYAYMPRVIARDVAGDMRVDLFFLDQGTHGLELFNVHWDNFTDGSGSVLRRVTTATREELELAPGTGARQFTGKLVADFITEVSSNGYDANFDGTNVVVVVHEETKSVYDYLNRTEWASKVDFRRNAYDHAEGGHTAPIPTANPLPAPTSGARNALRVIAIE